MYMIGECMRNHVVKPFALNRYKLDAENVTVPHADTSKSYILHRCHACIQKLCIIMCHHLELFCLLCLA